MINEKMSLEVVDHERNIKAQVQISELIELIYQAVYEAISRKAQNVSKTK